MLDTIENYKMVLPPSQGIATNEDACSLGFGILKGGVLITGLRLGGRTCDAIHPLPKATGRDNGKSLVL